MKKPYSVSTLNAGIIEELDASMIKPSPTFYPSIPTSLNELSNSIKEKGLLHAITVRPNEDHYEIVAGNRRYLACKMIGWRKILCHIVEIDDKEAFEISLIENIQRRSINPIEEAHAFRKYISDFGWGGVSDLASKIGKSVSYVDRRLRLLTLPENVLRKMTNSILSVGVAEELLPISNENRQSELADLVCKRRMSIRNVRKLIKDFEDSNADYIGSSKYTQDISTLDRKSRKAFDNVTLKCRHPDRYMSAQQDLSSPIKHIKTNLNKTS